RNSRQRGIMCFKVQEKEQVLSILVITRQLFLKWKAITARLQSSHLKAPRQVSAAFCVTFFLWEQSQLLRSTHSVLGTWIKIAQNGCFRKRFEGLQLMVIRQECRLSGEKYSLMK